MEGKAADLSVTKSALEDPPHSRFAGRSLLFCLASCLYVFHKEISIYENSALIPDVLSGRPQLFPSLVWKQTKAN